MKIGIIGAMEPEVAILKNAINNLEQTERGGFTFYHGELSGQEVVLVQSGIGKVASTVATTLLIQLFSPDCVINTGSAGGFEQSLRVGDVVIADELRHHDVDVTAFGYEMGQVPNMPAGFKSNDVIIEAAKAAVASLDGDIKTMVGLVCTGDSFMCDPVRIEKTRSEFPSMLAVEMEGAAIAQACHQLNTPFAVIRSLSDIAGKESPESFESYLVKASENSSAMVIELLKNLAGKTL